MTTEEKETKHTPATHCTQCGSSWDHHDGISVTCSNLQAEREQNGKLKAQNAELLKALNRLSEEFGYFVCIKDDFKDHICTLRLFVQSRIDMVAAIRAQNAELLEACKSCSEIVEAVIYDYRDKLSGASKAGLHQRLTQATRAIQRAEGAK